MDVFNQLKQTIQDFDVCWTLLEAARKETGDIMAAVLERIEGDKAAHAERVESLTAQSMNQAAPVVLRDLAARELEQIKGRTFGPIHGPVYRVQPYPPHIYGYAARCFRPRV